MSDAQQTAQPDQGPSRGAGRHRFPPGNPGAGYRDRAAERLGVRERPRILRAMRFVTNNPEAKDRTHIQKECRLWLKEDRGEFLRTLAGLEKALVVGQARRAASEAPSAGASDDPGTDRLEELIEHILREAGAPSPPAA